MKTILNKIIELLKKNLLLVILIANSAILLYALLTLEINIKNENFQFQFQSQDQRQWQMQQTVIINGKIFDEFTLQSEVWTREDCGLEKRGFLQKPIFGYDVYNMGFYRCIAQKCKAKPFGCSNIVVGEDEFLLFYWEAKNK